MRGKTILIFLSVIMLSLVFVSAAEVNITDFSCSNLIKYKSLAINQTIPKKALLDNETINIYIAERIYGNLILENSTIKDFSCEEKEKPTYKIYIENSKVIEDFLNSSDLVDTFKEKDSSEEIKIKGVGFKRKIKWSFVKFVLKLA